MTKEQTIALIIFLLVVTAVIAIIILVVARNEKYKKFIEENSQSIKKIEEINSRYIFKTYNQTVSFYHQFDKNFLENIYQIYHLIYL